MLLSAVLLLPQFATPQLQKEWDFQHLGIQVIENRFLDEGAGTIRREAWQVIPGHGQKSVTASQIDKWRRQDHLLGEQRRQKISPDLWQVLADAQATDVIEVVFWLECEDAPDWRNYLQSEYAAGLGIETARRNARDAAAEFFAPRIESFVEWCGEADVEVWQTLQGWPVVYGRLQVQHVAAAAANPLVDETYYCFPDAYTELDHAQGTMRTTLVWQGGHTAAGSPVKTMINDVDQVTLNNPYLPPIVRIYGSNTTGSHASGVAGNIAMNHTTLKGAAYGIPQLYSADGSGDSGAPLSWNAAISNGVSYGNCSWWNGSKGSIVYLDRYFDYTIRNYSVMMFKSTGNQGTTSTPYTTSPGNGFNSTNSGAYNDGNNTNWSDDAMASYSSYWDPAEGHEKPELANAGDDVDTAGTSNFYYGFGGTSSASPLTCGVATLLASRDHNLMAYPEALKAILMASAWHNIEGGVVLSEKDGAGGVHALAADNVVANGNYRTATLTAADFANANNAYDVTFPAAAGNQTRVCGLWFSSANSSYSTDVLNMDLDLLILDPSGNTVASSANALNPFEILKFKPPVTGYYTARFVSQRFDGTSEPFGVAWSSNMDTAECEVSHSGIAQVGASVQVDFSSPFQPNKWYQGHISSATIPATTDLGSGYILPLAQDSIFLWSATLPGFSGTLDSNGNASSSLSIPNNPSLANQVFYLAMYTKDTSASTEINTVSWAHQVTVLP